MKTEWLRKTIQDFEPYFVAPIAEKHVINANENYFNVLSIPAVKKELLEALDSFQPQIYPKPMADGLREVLADYMGVKPENIICGNGGDEMITYLLGTFLNPGDKLLVHTPTFDMYELGGRNPGRLRHQSEGPRRLPAGQGRAPCGCEEIPAQGDSHLQPQ